MEKTRKQRTPWAWVPTLYFAQGLPYIAVMTLSVIMYKKFGISNTDIALYTGWLYLPWVIKPFWSPFVDIISTKRRWILVMQWMVAAAFAAIALTVPAPMFFRLSLGVFWIVAFVSATHDIAADGFYMLALDEHQQSFYVGIRSTFYRIASVAGQGALVVVAGLIEERTGSLTMAWQTVFFILSALFLVFALYHSAFLPRVERPEGAERKGAGEITREFGKVFASFFTKPGIVTAIIFMLLYRLPEAFLIKMCMPFLVAAKGAGGLGLSTAEVGIVYGTIGVIFLTLGGILGGLFASRIGLKKSIWWMAACMTLPCLTFVYLAVCQPENLFAISTAIAIEQFGYGFGFTAYMLYMMYFSEGEFKTSHYAICTAFMALSMMIPGMFAGYIQEAIGYINFFWMVIICCVATVIVTIFADRRIDPEYGKK